MRPGRPVSYGAGLMFAFIAGHVVRVIARLDPSQPLVFRSDPRPVGGQQLGVRGNSHHIDHEPGLSAAAECGFLLTASANAPAKEKIVMNDIGELLRGMFSLRAEIASSLSS